MPIKRERKGEGILEREVTTVSRPFGPEERAAVLEMLPREDKTEETMRAILARVGVTSAQEVISETDAAYGWEAVAKRHGVLEGTPEHYAARVLNKLDFM